MNLKTDLLRLASGALLILVAVRCSGGSSQNPPGSPTSTLIGASGGTASSSDGALEVTIPDGALASNVAITLTPTASPAAGAIGTAYAVGPAGTTFAQPATVTFSYAGAELGGQAPSALRVATYVGGTWQALPGYALSATAQTVSGTTTRVGTFALWAAASSGSGACASITVGAVCGGSSSSSGASSSSGGVTCTTPTCATSASTACAGYPGAAVQSCVDSADGPTVDCCFAAGAPICFGVAGPVACSGGGSSSSTGSSSGGSSSGGVTCTPATCAASAATACAQYPGASMSACTDSANGYQASCCYPSGQPVCVQDGESAGCGSSSSSGASSGGISCGPSPTCAGSTPCGSFSGTTVQSCTDNAQGYTAACCYPLGTLPPVNSGETTLSGGSSSGGGSGSGGGSSSSSSGG